MARKARGIVSRSQSLPAPVGGWNAFDSIANMPPSDAVDLNNWFPANTELRMRLGYSKYSTGISGTVETIFSYAGGSTTKLFGVASGSIYDCTAGGVVGAAVVSGLSNSRFQYINMTTPGGNFLMAVNGADKMRYFDGTTWSADGGTYTITGADTSNWVGLTIHKQRVWGIQKGTLKAYYLPVSSIAGAASTFDLSAFFKLGGELKAVANWTIDAGQGLDDYLVFVSSRGEVLVYGGNDPLGAWAMKGLYSMGAPIGNRCLMKMAGDLLVICQDGLFPLSSAIQSDRLNPSQAISKKIMYAVSSAISTYGANFGWQTLSFPRENMLLLNVPIGVGLQEQYVMNTISGAWCRFTGWGASCWELYKDDPYFGGAGYIGKAWDTSADAGTNIQADGIQAFTYLRTPGQLKRFTMIRPMIRASSLPTIDGGLQIDFDTDTSSVAPLSFSPSGVGIWDTSLWDSATWGAGLAVYRDWQGASGVGYAAAPRVRCMSQGLDVRWASTDMVYEAGGIL